MTGTEILGLVIVVGCVVAIIFLYRNIRKKKRA